MQKETCILQACHNVADPQKERVHIIQRRREIKSLDALCYEKFEGAIVKKVAEAAIVPTLVV